MLDVKIIGIGSGQPDQLTGSAVRAMRAVDVFLVADKGAAQHDLAALRRELCEHVLGRDQYRVVEVADPRRDRRPDDYPEAVRQWHAARVSAYVEVIRRELPGGGTVGFLVWGDPAFYDSTVRVAEQLADAGLELRVEVVPGISSIQLLAAAHRIALNRVGHPVHVTTGRRLLAEYRPDLGDVVVMLDGELTCAGLVPRHPDLRIFWGGQLGLPEERVIAGRLADVLGDIRAVRQELRRRRGWVLDTYLLRPSE